MNYSFWYKGQQFSKETESNRRYRYVVIFRNSWESSEFDKENVFWYNDFNAAIRKRNQIERNSDGDIAEVVIFDLGENNEIL